ncbi:phosphoglycerate kinase [Oligoflexia bacterium]|nr:phosphoglycerate kinase [Oligoflexia bacterium]
MEKLSVQDLDLKGKRVLMRVDFNVPVKDDCVTDDTRICAALPTINYILDNGGRLILMSHLGRPKGEVKPEFSLKPVAARLSELLGKPIPLAADCVGEEVALQAKQLSDGEVLLLENVRFHKEEVLLNKYDKQDQATKAKIDQFSKTLASLGEVYVNDAFGTAHRAHASTQGVTKHFSENACGFLLEKEIKYFGQALAAPEHPFLAILGGAKVSDKIQVITNLLDKVDSLIIGGAMAYTFLKAQGLPIGTSLVEEDKLELAGNILAQAKEKGIELLLPLDHVVAANFEATEPLATVTEIKDDQMGLDIGPQTVELYQQAIAKAKTVVWNGPMGVFEKSAFAKGTFAVAAALAECNCVSIVGGGDSVAAVNQSGLSDRITHISTGGGASLEFLEGKVLPGVAALSDK